MVLRFLLGLLAVFLLNGCGTVMNPRIQSPSDSYYIGEPNTQYLRADTGIKSPSWVLVAQQTGSRRYVRLVKGNPALVSIDSLISDSAWVKAPYGTIWSGRLNRLQRKAGHGKKEHLAPKLKVGNLHVFGFAEKRFKWALGLNQTILVYKNRYRSVEYKEVDLGIELDLGGNRLRVKIKNKTDEPIRIWEPNVRERFQVEALGRGKSGIHVFWADSSFQTEYLKEPELKAKQEAIVVEMPLDKLIGSNPAGRWVKKNEAERPDQAKGDRWVTELQVWVNLNYRGKARVSPMIRIPIMATANNQPIAQ